MESLQVVLATGDPEVRMAAALAFDGAPSGWSLRLEMPDAPVRVRPDELLLAGPDCPQASVPVFDPRAGTDLMELIRGHAGEGPSRCVVVTGTGGSGATSVALHLARAWARYKSCCVVDLDHIWGGLRDRLKLPSSALTAAHEPLEEAFLPVPGGFRVLLGTTTSEAQVGELLTAAADAFQAVIADVPNGPALEPALQSARAAVLVATPSPSGAARAARILERWPDLKWGTVLNRTGPGGELTVSAWEQIAGHRVTLELPCFAGLRDAEDEGRLVTAGWSRWLRAVERLARAEL